MSPKKPLVIGFCLPILAQEFLFYYEKSPPDRIRDTNGEEQQRRAWDPLVKQTYSVWVDGPKGRRKWHLSKSGPPLYYILMTLTRVNLSNFNLAAYFTQGTVEKLRTVEDFPHLACLDVPPGKYISTRLGKPRTQSDTSTRHPSIIGSDNRRALDVFRPGNVQPYRTYAPFPMPYQGPPSHPHAYQHSPDVHQQYYAPPPPPAAVYDYYGHQNGRSALPESQRTYYGE